jgi:hypothetical protein
MNVSGDWIGSYSYAEQYRETASPEPTSFQMSLRDILFGRRVLGTVQDDRTRGIPEEAEIRGSRFFSRLSFWKSYPVLRVWDPKSQGTISLEELVKREFDELTRDPVPPRHIRYRGRIATTGSEMEGTWSMRPEKVFLPKLNGWLTLPGCHGTWEARRRFPVNVPNAGA